MVYVDFTGFSFVPPFGKEEPPSVSGRPKGQKAPAARLFIASIISFLAEMYKCIQQASLKSLRHYAILCPSSRAACSPPERSTMRSAYRPPRPPKKQHTGWAVRLLAVIGGLTLLVLLLRYVIVPLLVLLPEWMELIGP